MELLTTKEASVILGVSRRRVIALIEQGKLKARKFSSVYIITPKDLEAVKNRKNGRPENGETERDFETGCDLAPQIVGSINSGSESGGSRYGENTTDPDSNADRKSGKHISFAEAAAKYIGCIDDDLPIDLSTNKKYMDGFGLSRKDAALKTARSKRRNG
jgi:excisionase family DNA binding protein